jgi:hypothetical protein
MPHQMCQLTIPEVADRRNPLAPEIRAAFENFSIAASADGAHVHSSAALTAMPEDASQP